MNARRLKMAASAVLLALATVLPVARAQIYNWNTGEVIPGTEGITPGPGMNLSYWNTDPHNLRYADLSGGLDLTGSQFYECWFDHAWFMGANLRNAFISTSSLANANMAGADATYAWLEGITFANANLNGTDFTNAWFDYVDLTNADLSGAVIAPAEFANPVGFTAAQLYSTASYASGNLRGLSLWTADLSNWNFANQDLTNAHLTATLTNANFTGADLTHAGLYGTLDGASFDDATVRGMDLRGATTRGFTAAQLYSTASYEVADLRGIDLEGNDMTGWSFANQNLSGARLSSFFLFPDNRSIMDNADLSGANLTNAELTAAMLTGADLSGANLTNAYLSYATLIGADLSRADTRGAWGLTAAQLASAITDDTILPDGHIAGLDLGVNETLKVRDYDGGIAITVDDAFQMDADSTLAIILGDAAWGSTISLADGVLANLDGTLALTFAPGTDVGSLLGVTFDLFNWNGGLLPGDAFASVQWPAGFDWNLSDLYVGGHVTLTAIPEPATVILLSLGALTFRRRR